MGNWDWDGAGRSLAAQRGLEMHEGEESWERQRLSSHWAGWDVFISQHSALGCPPHRRDTPLAASGRCVPAPISCSFCKPCWGADPGACCCFVLQLAKS